MIGAVRTRSLVGSFALFALGLAVPLVTLSLVAVSWYVSSERARLDAVVQLKGDRLRDRLDRDLSEMTAIARTLAASPTIDSGDVAAFDAQARAVVDAQETTVMLSELSGRHLANTRVPPGQALPTIPRQAITDAVVRTRKPVVSGLLVSGMTGRRIIGVYLPVIRAGVVTKIVAVVARIEHFEALIAREGIAAPYSASILDGEHHVIALARGAPGSDDHAAAEVAAPGEAIAYEHLSTRSDWTVVTGVEKAALEAPLRHSVMLLAGIALLLGALAGLLAVPSARRVAAAMRAFAAAAETIGRGDRVTLEASPIREVDLLGRALGAASRTIAEQRETLAEARAGLEAEVAERGRALDESRAHHRILAENVGDVVIMRRQGRQGLSYVSPSCTRVFGYEPEAIKGFAIADTIHPDDVESVMAVDAALGAGRSDVACLFRTRRRDGAWIWVESVSRRIASAAEGEPDVIWVLRDVTERQAHAEELRIARDMAELAQAKAENANRSKSEFLVMMSHEIRTPLSTIKGFSELLADTAPLSPEQSRYIALVSDATATMLTAVDDILDFARIEGGDLRVEPKAFALSGAVEDVAGFLRPVAARRGVAVGATIDPDLPRYVLGDQRRLRQILFNLMHALLRSRRGGLVTLSVQRRQGASPERIGISLIASGGRAAAADAGGLGRAIAGRLIGLLGGRLETAGTGEPSSYRFTLPLPAAEPPAPETVTDAATLGRPARLLLVEDHPINREVACRLLESAGHVVETAEDGPEAVAAVQTRAYDVVLMDVQLPGMDGLAATRRIRALQHPCRLVPILALTASVLPEQIRAFQEAGMNGHVAKPVDRRSLFAAVEAQLASTLVLETRRGGGEAPTIFDRAAYDGLVAGLGEAAATQALRGFVVLLDAAHADDRLGWSGAQADAESIAVAARRLGFLDLASAHDRLAAAANAEAERAALNRARIARDLARRVFGELGAPETVAPKAKMALL